MSLTCIYDIDRRILSLPANDNGLLPPWYQLWDVLDYNWLSKHGAIQNVSDGSIGASPHLFEAELRHSVLVWCDSSALYAHAYPLWCMPQISANMPLDHITCIWHYQKNWLFVELMMFLDEPLEAPVQSHKFGVSKTKICFQNNVLTQGLFEV